MINMSNKEFLQVAEEAVRKYTHDYVSATAKDYDVWLVWSCKTIQNHKAIMATSLNDHMLYEITHNGDKDEIYVDAYLKVGKKIAKVEDEDEPKKEEIVENPKYDDKSYQDDIMNIFDLLTGRTAMKM